MAELPIILNITGPRPRLLLINPNAVIIGSPLTVLPISRSTRNPSVKTKPTRDGSLSPKATPYAKGTVLYNFLETNLLLTELLPLINNRTATTDRGPLSLRLLSPTTHLVLADYPLARNLSRQRVVPNLPPHGRQSFIVVTIILNVAYKAATCLSTPPFHSYTQNPQLTAYQQFFPATFCLHRIPRPPAQI